VVVGALAELVARCGQHRQRAAAVPRDADLDLGRVAGEVADAGDGAAIAGAQPREGIAGDG
jgi:hypothetical protein